MRICREALQQDLADICGLATEINALHHDAWPHIFANPLQPQQHAAHGQHSIGAAKATTFVCAEGAAMLGFVTVFIAQDSSPLLQPAAYARVGTVCVAATHRGAGIGTALMQLAEQWAVARGVADIRLHVWDFNRRAMRLYAELGYATRSHTLGKRLLPGG